MDAKDNWIAAEQTWLDAWIETKKLRERADKLKEAWIDEERKQKESE